MNHYCQMIAGLTVGFSIVGLVVLLCSRRMLIVHGTRRQYKAGFLRALVALLRMYFLDYSNTLFVDPNCKVVTHQEERELTKNQRKRRCQTHKSMMIFEVEL